MDCLICKNNPTYLCRCENAYLCDIHVFNHMKLNLWHNLENLKIVIDPDKKMLLEKELDCRITTLTRLEQDIIIKTKQFIKTIKEKSNSLVQEINKIITNYKLLKFKDDIEKSQLQEIDSIISSKLTQNYINTHILNEEIEKFYCNKFYEIISDEMQEKNIRKLNFLQKHSSDFTCLDITNDGKFLVSGSSDSCIRIWDLQSKELNSCLINHKEKINVVSLSLDNKLLLSASDDRTVILWNFVERCLMRIYTKHIGPVSCAFFTNCSKYFVSLSSQQLMLREIDSDKILSMVILEKYASCGKIFATNEIVVYYESTIEIFDATTLDSKILINIKELCGIESLEFSKDSNFMALAVNFDVLLYSFHDIKLVSTFSGHSEPVSSVSITDDNKLLVSGSLDSKIILWSLKTKRIFHKFSFHENEVYQVKIFKDFIFSASNDNQIGIISISKLSLESSLTLEEMTGSCKSFRNNLCIYGYFNDLILCDNYNDEIFLKGHLNPVLSCCISNSMKFLISSSKEVVKNLLLWDLQTLKIICDLIGHENSVICTDISNNDMYAISGDVYGTVILWNLVNYSQEKVLQSCIHFEVLCVRFSRNSRFASYTGPAGNFSIWDIENKTLDSSTYSTKRFIKNIWVSDDDKYFVYEMNYNSNLKLEYKIKLLMGKFNEILFWNINEKKIEEILVNQTKSHSLITRYKELESEMMLDFSKIIVSIFRILI